MRVVSIRRFVVAHVIYLQEAVTQPYTVEVVYGQHCAALVLKVNEAEPFRLAAVPVEVLLGPQFLFTLLTHRSTNCEECTSSVSIVALSLQLFVYSVYTSNENSSKLENARIST